MDDYEFRKHLPDYYNSFSDELIYSQLKAVAQDSVDDDPDTLYTLNSNGFRSPEFSGPVDLVALGCSQTFGMGVPDNGTWAAVLAKKLGGSYVNISIPGASIGYIVDKFFQYISLYGAPKMVSFLMPGLERVDILSVPGIIEVSNDFMPPEVHMNTSPVNLSIRGINHGYIPSYSKKPYNFYEILPYETAAFESLKALVRLIHICKTLNIKLALVSWHLEAHSFFLGQIEDGRSKLDLSSYIVDSPAPDQYYIHEIGCHNDPSPEHASSWNFGTDKGHHMGRHQHIHYAEAFYDKLAGDGS